MEIDEMDDDNRRKRGREVKVDTIYDQIKTKEQDMRELKEEIRELREEIRELIEEIRKREEEIKKVQADIAIASGPEVRMPLEATLQFLRQETTSIRQEIGSRDQQICNRQQQISNRQQQISNLQQEINRTRSVQEASASAEKWSRSRASWTVAVTLALAYVWKALLQSRGSYDPCLIPCWMHSAESSVARDNSAQWIKCMSVVKPKLPRSKADVTRVLFPDVHGKLPVHKQAYHMFTMTEGKAEEYLEEADESMVPTLVTAALYGLRASISEMDVTSFMSSHLILFFDMLKNHSPHVLVYTLSFNCNCNEKTGESFSDVTVDRSRPDTLCVASGRTLLIGEDKFKGLCEAQQDLRKKLKKLPTIYYGELDFILGYVAAGSMFQWVYVGKNGGHDLSVISPCLDLSHFEHRCKFYLSLGYVYHLLCSMVDAIPEVQSDRAMFSKDVHGDRTIEFLPDSVRKSVKNFERNCEIVETTVKAVRKAYEVAKRCHYLPQRVSDEVRRSGTYIIEYGPVGYPLTLRSERDLRNMARCVCEALRVLHRNGLVHRDIRPANIVQISKDEFMLIDLESAAACRNRVLRFAGFRGWSSDTLDNGVYTKMSDMHQLGRLLDSVRDMVVTTNAEAFVQRLLSKNLSAELALKDPWLSSPMP